MESVRQFLLENRARINPDRFSAIEEHRARLNGQQQVTKVQAEEIFGHDFYPEFDQFVRNRLPEVIRELLED